ncbi:MAG: excalibur calcium-binding domain-containing protein [Burkholderiaceae bacterium]
MKNLVVLAVLGSIAWFAYGKHGATQTATANVAASTVPTPPPSHPPPAQQFRCDGRTYCSQMRSCEEATYFIRHCPNTKMDGDNDGVPCERQWCNK